MDEKTNEKLLLEDAESGEIARNWCVYGFHDFIFDFFSCKKIDI